MSDEAFYTIAGLSIIGMIIFFIIIGVILLALYVLTAYPLFQILKAVDYDLAWLAWIPFCQYFAIAMAFNYKNEPNIQAFGIPMPRPAAGFASLIASILAKFIPFIGKVFPILALLINGCILGEMYDVCEDSEPGKNLGMGIVSSLIWFVQIYMLFKFMGKAKRGEIDLKTYAARHQ